MFLSSLSIKILRGGFFTELAFTLWIFWASTCNCCIDPDGSKKFAYDVTPGDVLLMMVASLFLFATVSERLFAPKIDLSDTFGVTMRSGNWSRLSLSFIGCSSSSLSYSLISLLLRWEGSGDLMLVTFTESILWKRWVLRAPVALSADISSARYSIGSCIFESLSLAI